MELMNDLSNEQLLIAVQAGNGAAFSEVYYRFRKKVYGYALRFTRSNDDAEELTQDVFVRVWENRSKIDPQKNFEGFLYTLIRNTYLKALRRSAKEVLFSENMVEEPYHNAIDEHVDFRDCQYIANSAIEDMSPQVKIAYLLSREQGCSHTDISKMMGISKSTVNNHIKKSLKTVRKYFKVYSPETVLSLLLMLFY